MTVDLIAVVPRNSRGRGVRRYYDAQSECAFFVSEPGVSPELWHRYLGGALDVYRRFGVEHALEYDTVADGESTSLFFAALDADGDMVAGVRMQGPYTDAEQAHALVEWAGHPGAEEVRRMIADRIPHGVVEAKGAWVARDAAKRAELGAAISRTVLHGARLLGARYGFATVASFTVARHSACGAVPAEHIPSVPYPDERYQTVPLWWDTRGYAVFAEEAQRSLTHAEQDALGLPAARPLDTRCAIGCGTEGRRGYGR
ncbi:hypothetical protein IU486_18070 [Streptomyces gardneri]|uniref:hypothetical protein n=1 Tax=Nocardia TaxID=1817 RepID=UPI001895870E|nr:MULTISPECIES: hypothetical protein [Nocardia]MBF6166643.1 hypothetical protein [Streptomyces gardneri]MBF6205429.1 hypothetical protein [Streptomyces gardneri]UAK34698.1 hypothetical protein K8O92_13150 [Nocardia asteroides]